MSTMVDRPKARVRPTAVVGIILLVIGFGVIGMAAIPGLNLLSSDSMPLALVIAVVAIIVGIVLTGIGMMQRGSRRGDQDHV